ncbi:MAG: hypothetical protein KatS3mg068_0995 [Candidatus Sericytochromatia bacterium]|nr:MAG: hypothetical protein KatS3mg068_0995 [Candidatus Sericytochromatia bacterium]
MQIGNSQSLSYINNKDSIENKKDVSNEQNINIKTNSDSLKTSSIANTKKNYITSNLNIEIKDKDGFDNFGKADIRAKVTGDIKLTKDFMLSQLANALKDDKDKKFNPPRFDEKRNHYIISGTAKNAILNAIDVDFEIRLGEKNGNLCFLVDSFITRGSIYSDLKKMLLDAGINTFEKDNILYIKPTLGQTIDIPISKEKNQIGRIEWIDTNLDNTKAYIDKSGNVTIKVNNVDIIASTDVNKINKTLQNPDIAKVKFDFSIDNDMKLKGKFSEGSINAELRENLVNQLIDNSKILREQLGKAFTLSLTGLSGNIDLTNGLKVNAKSDVKINSGDNNTQIDTKLNASIDDKIINIKADYLNGKLKDNQKIIAENILFSDNNQGNRKISFNILESNISLNGVKINAKGNTLIENNNDKTEINFDGNINANTNKENSNGTLETKGKHFIKIGSNNIDINIDYAKIAGKFNTLIKGNNGNNNNSSNNNQNININVKDINADAEIITEPTNIKANVSNGGVKINVNGDNIKVNTTSTINANAEGKMVNAKATIKGGEVNIKNGNIDIKSQDVNAEGSFVNKQGKLKISGNVKGKTNVNIDKEGNVKVNQDGKFDAKFNSNNKIKIDGKGTKAEVKVFKNEDVNINLNNFEAKTDIKANKVLVKTNSKGQEIKVKVTQEGNNISVKSKNTQSTANINVNEGVFSGEGKAGDVDIQVNTSDKGDDVKIGVKKVDFRANVKNKNENLNVDITTKADANIHVSRNGSVKVSSRNASITTADFTLVQKDTKEQKIKTSAIGKDFEVTVTEGKVQDINVKLKSADFNATITPNQDLKTEINSETKSGLSVKVTEEPNSTKVKVNSTAPLKGNISVKENVQSEFSNKKGFTVNVNEDPEITKVDVKVDRLDIKGNVTLDKNNIDVNGSGDLRVSVNDKQNEKTKVNIEYNKHNITGKISANDLAQGNYNINGNLKVNIDGDKVSVNNVGKLNSDVKSPKFGVGTNVNIEGTDKEPISINVDNEVDVKISHPGYIELKDIKSLKLPNNQDKTLNYILQNLISNNITIYTKDIEVKNNAQFVKTNLKTSTIRTQMGRVDLSMDISKSNSTVEIKNGSLELMPSIKLYELIEKEINDKYNIKINGKPELKNGVLTIKGEVKSRAGVVQLADFNIKMSVENNKLVLDLDKAKVLKVIGTGTVGNFVNKVLSKTDIDIFKVSNKKMIIDLNDIVKDLKLTQGINFNTINLKDNKFIIGFEYNSIDQQISSFAKNNDLKGLESYLKTADYSHMTGKGLSTAYTLFANSGSIDKASTFVTDIANKYVSDNTINKKEFEEGLEWISKNVSVKKQNISDNISLEFTKKNRIKNT